MNEIEFRKTYDDSQNKLRQMSMIATFAQDVAKVCPEYFQGDHNVVEDMARLITTSGDKKNCNEMLSDREMVTFGKSSHFEVTHH